MESQLFNDLRKSLRAANEVWCPGDQTLKTLARALAKHANKKQVTALAEEFDGVFGLRAGKLTVKGSTQTRVAVDNRDQSDHVKMGRYGTKVQAKAAAKQLMTPDAISYQSALFPNPKDYTVNVEVRSANPVEAEGGNPLYPWTLDVDLHVTGDTMRVASWMRSFEEKVRAQV
jgi:hypothetical protein